MDEPVTFIDSPPVASSAPPADTPSVVDQPVEAGVGATTTAMEAKVLEAIEVIRPALQMDGGDMNLVRVDEATGVVDIELVGACGSCPASIMTLSSGIERILKDRVEGVTEVNAIGMDAGL
jgi:Fe-S cluster biogenesis protein NfuA